MKPARTLDELRRKRPEWGTWLALLAEVRAAAGTPAWRSIGMDVAPDRAPDTPLLQGATLAIDAAAADRLLRRLVTIATQRAASAAHDTRAVATLARRFDALEFIECGLAGDVERLSGDADGLLDMAALAALASLAAVPAARASARAHPEAAAGWTPPYCPVCGGWPAFAEERGLERSRRYRCGMCETDWWAAWLTCPYCGETEHERLATLTVEDDGTRRVDVCHRCDGYVKTLTVLTAVPDVALVDADTVELDLAARAHGCTRPETPGHRVRCHVTARPGLGRRLLSWTR